MFGRFGQVVEKKKSITLQDVSAVRYTSIYIYLSTYLSICLSVCLSNLVLLYVFFPSSCQEERRQLSSMLGCEISSMLCVPVVSRATAQVVALACAFNKQGGLRFVYVKDCVHTCKLSLDVFPLCGLCAVNLFFNVVAVHNLV